MKKAYPILVISILLVLAFQGCAKRGTPDGGPEDMTPPGFVRAEPENFTTNFDGREIRIFFDEYIKLNEAQRQIIISPPMDPRAEITPLGTASKSVRIRIHDTLQPNTTYAINFGRSIVDNNAGNPLEFFQYIFSTGSYIDSLAVSGYISDAYLKQPDPFISVMLYEIDSTYSDSTVYLESPRYITNTLDSTTTFQLNNLKEGTYQMIALSDLNNNYTFEPEKEKIAFLGNPITVPTDSVYELRLFKETSQFGIGRPKMVAEQHLIFGYTGEMEPDSLQIRMYPVPEDFEHRITKDREKDTLHYWYKPLIERDSLHFIVEAPNYRDSLLTRRTEMESDSLEISFEPSGNINFDQELNILPTTPLAATEDSLISLVNKDTIAVPFDMEYDSYLNKVVLNFEKEEDQVYTLEALPGAFTDFFGSENDTIRSKFRTKTFADFGVVVVNLQGVEEFPILVQLTNEAGEVQAEQISNGETSFRFPYLDPETYFIRIVYDTNNNGIWDTGSYLSGQQPERTYHFPDPLQVRANWDVSQLVILE